MRTHITSGGGKARGAGCLEAGGEGGGEPGGGEEGDH